MGIIEHENTTVAFSSLTEEVCENWITAVRLTKVVLTGDAEASFRFSRTIRGHPHLKEFSLVDVACESDKVDLNQVVSMILVSVPNLEILKAEQTPLSSATLSTVGFCSTIKMLILPNNELTDKDAATIAESLAVSHSLQLLDLRGNKMTDVGCGAFAKAIDKNMTLCSIMLDENSCSDKGLGAISGAIEARSAKAA